MHASKWAQLFKYCIDNHLKNAQFWPLSATLLEGIKTNKNISYFYRDFYRDFNISFLFYFIFCIFYLFSVLFYFALLSFVCLFVERVLCVALETLKTRLAFNSQIPPAFFSWVLVQQIPTFTLDSPYYNYIFLWYIYSNLLLNSFWEAAKK